MNAIGPLSGLRWLAAIALAFCLGGCEALNPVASDNKNPTQGQVESSLTCQCGCGLTVHSCNHLNCSSGEPLKVEIAGQIAKGSTLPEILSHFENKYGEIILSSPNTARSSSPPPRHGDSIWLHGQCPSSCSDSAPSASVWSSGAGAAKIPTTRRKRKSLRPPTPSSARDSKTN